MSNATSSRETRDSAREIKFLVDTDSAARIREWARARLSPDPYAAGPSGDAYTTTSIYLDSEALDVFHRRGSYGRSKYRIRRYGAADVAFLERKLRVSSLLNKRRTVIPVGDLAHLPQPIDAANSGFAGTWFARRIAIRRLRPTLQVTYQRTARVGPSTWGPMRLTLDEHITTVPTQAFAFHSSPGTPVLEDRMIVELKFRLQMPAVFRNLIEEFALAPVAVSKYRLSAARLGLGDPALAAVRPQGVRDA